MSFIELEMFDLVPSYLQCSVKFNSNLTIQNGICLFVFKWRYWFKMEDKNTLLQ